MERFNDESLNALSNYFKVLSTFGYISYNEVNKLIIFLFIRDMLDWISGGLIDEEDYKDIEEALNCLYGSGCLLPYPKYNRDTSLIKAPFASNHRITESCILRYTEDGGYIRTEA